MSMLDNNLLANRRQKVGVKVVEGIRIVRYITCLRLRDFPCLVNDFLSTYARSRDPRTRVIHRCQPFLSEHTRSSYIEPYQELYVSPVTVRLRVRKLQPVLPNHHPRLQYSLEPVCLRKLYCNCCVTLCKIYFELLSFIGGTTAEDYSSLISL